MSSVRNRISEGMTRERLRLETKRAARPFVIWTVLLAGGLLAGAYTLAHLEIPWPWQKTYEVRFALRPDAKGIVPRSNDLRIAGVPVGRITGVRLDHGRQIVTARVDPKYGALYRNARARLRPATPLEDQYIDIVDRGTPTAGKLPSGGLLPMASTSTPVDFGQFMNIFDADVRPRLSTAIEQIGRGLSDHGADLKRALTELAPFLDAARRMTHETAIRQRQTKRLVHNFDLVNAELARRDEQLTRLVSSGDATLTTIASVDAPLGALIEQLPPTLRVLPSSFATLRAAADELDPTAQALLPVARALPDGLAAVQRLSPALSTAMAALEPALPKLTSLLTAARPLGSGLADAFARLRPNAPRLDRITAAAVPCELAIQKFFMNTISVIKLGDAHGAFPRGQRVEGVPSTGVRPPGYGYVPGCAKGEPRK